LPHVVFTGGDPLERADLLDLIRHARALGLGVSVAPSATPRLDEAAILALKERRDAGDLAERSELDPFAPAAIAEACGLGPDDAGGSRRGTARVLGEA
jgi:hypothetical protein